MVPKGGLEPPRDYSHWSLKPACIPISPLRHRSAAPGAGALTPAPEAVAGRQPGHRKIAVVIAHIDINIK